MDINRSEKNPVVAVTGGTGNMGQAVLGQLLQTVKIGKLKLLVLPDDKRIGKILKLHKKFRDKIEVILGNIADRGACEKLVQDADYVVNMAAVIPPLSDREPQKAVECNQTGVDVLVGCIEKIKPNQPKLIHVSTVALYGNRNFLHPWGRVGDPLTVSPFDIYAITKLRGEFRVLESDIENFAVLRQTAMLHSRMLADNMSDGLMFHTCFNAPLEWVTAHDSGVLIANIIKSDLNGDLKDKFWKKCFNIGGRAENRITGYDTLNDGFKLIGGGTKDFFSPCYNATRNFHGVWFYDGDKLDEMFRYISQTTEDFWKEFASSRKYFKLAKILPKSLIKKFAIKRLFKNPNSPKYWADRNDEARLFAYFGGKDKFQSLPAGWQNFGLLIENRDENGNALDYVGLKDKKRARTVDLGIDADAETLTLEDLKTYARMHGGKLLSEDFKSLYDRAVWQNSDGEKFEARIYTVVKAGHWKNASYSQNVWDFDRLAKQDKIYSQIWYDSHAADENKFYFFDENFAARMENL